MVTTEKLTLDIVTDIKCEFCGKNIIFKCLMPNVNKKIGRYQVCECVRKYNNEWRSKHAIEQKNKQINRLVGNSRLPERFKNISFNSINKTKYNSLCLESLEKFVESFEKDKSFMLSAPVGRGKTLMVCATANGLLAKNRSVIFVVVPDMLTKLRASYNSRDSISESKLLYGLTECELLILDDIGAEKHKESDDNDWASEKIFQIINSRYNAQKSTIFTTNDNADALSKKLGERTVSRIVEMCKGNTFKSLRNEKDWRLS